MIKKSRGGNMCFKCCCEILLIVCYNVTTNSMYYNY